MVPVGKVPRVSWAEGAQWRPTRVWMPYSASNSKAARESSFVNVWILTGEGNTDSAITVTGLVVGAAFCHNFGLAGGADSVVDGVYKVGGPGINGKVMVVVGLVVCTIIACVNTFSKKEK